MRWGPPGTAPSPAAAAAAPGAATRARSSCGMPPIASADVSIGVEIGKGRFKQVHRGNLRRTGGPPFDVVILKYEKGCEKRELQVLALLARHPHSSAFVPEIHGACDEGTHIALVLQERAIWGSLKSALACPDVAPRVTPGHSLRAAKQVALAMDFLESCSIIHADLSCRNILLLTFAEQDPDCTLVKVTDFGLAVVLRRGAESEVRKQPQATRWCAPETVAHNRLSHRSDAWSLGTTLWELFSGGASPWARWEKRSNIAARLRALADGSSEAGGEEGIAEDFPPPDGCCPLAAHDCVLSCLRVDERARPTFRQLAESFDRVIEDHERPEPVAAPDNGSAGCSAEVMPLEAARGCSATVSTPREAEDPSPSTAPPTGTGTTPHTSATPSTSATPTVPWHGERPDWSKKAKTAPLDEPRAAAFAEALKDFLCAPHVVDLLGEKAGFEALKEFLRSPHALELLGTGLDGVRARREPAAQPEELKEERVRNEYLMDLERRRTAARRLSVCSRLSVGSPWTLWSLVSPTELRRQDFADYASAWAVFNATTGVPCMLRDPSGADAAARSWIVVDRVRKPRVSTQLVATPLSQAASHSWPFMPQPLQPCAW